VSHSYVKNILHVIFSTKERGKFIPRNFQTRLWSYIAGVCRNRGLIVDAIGGTDDHIHLLIEIPPKLSVSEAMAAIKANSSRWANTEGLDFAWQEGYAAFSVSESDVPALRRYIHGQEAHHKKISFDEEFIGLLNAHHVEFDPKYVLG